MSLIVVSVERIETNLAKSNHARAARMLTQRVRAAKLSEGALRSVGHSIEGLVEVGILREVASV